MSNPIVCDTRIKQAFKTFDYNRKGFITIDELERLLRSFGLEDVSKQLVASFMRSSVTTGNRVNEVSYDDTLRIIQGNYTQGSTEEIWTVYKLLDASNLGRIKAEDLRNAAVKYDCCESYISPEGVEEQAERLRRKIAASKRRQQLAARREKRLKEQQLRDMKLHPRKDDLSLTVNLEMSDISVNEVNDINIDYDAGLDDSSTSIPATPNESSSLGKPIKSTLSEECLEPAPLTKNQRAFGNFIQLVAEYPDKGVTFEEWRRVQVKANDSDDRNNYDSMSMTGTIKSGIFGGANRPGLYNL
eukprot:Tbor_TRINITY_DN4490_c0_g2::TRINITY_DN4490_c0_g2_i1::g.8023::m.8023